MPTRTIPPGELERELAARMAAVRPTTKAPRRSRTRAHGRARARFVGLLGVIALMTVGITGAFAVHAQDFELDGNAVDPVPGLPDDWSAVFGGTDSALESTFVHDPIGGNADPDEIFTIGGSKDDLDIAAGGVPGAAVGPWHHTIGNVPDKDNITDAFAAAYGCDDFVNPDPNSNEFEDPGSEDDLCLYFGLDRFARNGDAQVGFWFFQSEHALNPDGSFANPHDFGDLLVLSDFTNGGVVSTIRVFRWVGTGGDTNDTLDNIFNGVACGVSAVDPACALSNTTNQPSPWPYTPKSGSANVFPPGSFFEGGLNLSALGLDIGCGAGFLAETRSSQSVDAQLKDFALGSFQLCDIDVTKTGDANSKVGDAANYTVTIQNTGSVTLYKDDISDDILGAITTNGVDQANPNVVTNTCGASLASGATCTITLARTTQAGDPDPLVNTVTAVYNSNSALTGADVSDFDDHSLNLFQPSVTIDKTGDTLSKVGDDVNYTITVTNTSSADSPDLTCSVNDTLLGAFGPATRASGATWVINTSRTTQAGDPDPLVNTATVTCSPAGFPNVLTASDGHSVNLFQPSVTIDKTGDTLSKVGDDVNYTITVTNTSSADSPNCVGAVADALLGINQAVNMAPGAVVVINTSRTTLAGDPDTIVNTATVTCSPAGFPNVLTASDGHSVNLFQPSVTVDKLCTPALLQVGGTVTFTCTVTNTSSADSPDLIFASLSDLLDQPAPGPDVDLTAAATAAMNASACTVLSVGEVCSFSYTFVPTIVGVHVNTIAVHYNPSGFPNDIWDDGQCTFEAQGGEGCTPGFFKRWTNVWDGPTDAISIAIEAAAEAKYGDAAYVEGLGVTDQLFASIFGLTPAQMTAAGLDPNMTMEQAINLGGGGFNAIARHGVAALLSSVSVAYPYSADSVLTKVHDAIVTLTVEPTLTQLSDANNLSHQNCPKS